MTVSGLRPSSPLRAAVLSLLLAASAATQATAQADSPSDAEDPSPLVEGIVVNDSTLSAYKYVLYDNRNIEIGFLGRLDSPPQISEGEFSMPDSAIYTLELRDRQFFLMHDRIAEASGDSSPERRFGVHLEQEQLRLQFDQGLPIWLALLVSAGLILLGGAGVGVLLIRRERQRLKEEAEARQRALHAREAERTRIAREIHDGPLQDVHALRLLSGTQNEALGEEANRIARELRAIAEGLRPPALGRFGLAAALSAHANRVKERYADVMIGLDLDEDSAKDDPIPDVARSALFRIAQESITNAIEHGGASRVDVTLGLPDGDGDIVLDIQDNGTGFPWGGSQPDLSALADDGHFGLVGMHERVAAIGGTLTLSSDGLQGEGAHVHVTLPDVRRTGLGDSVARRPNQLVPA